MFQFPSFASWPYFTRIKIMDISTHGVAPFGNVRVKACLAARRTLSWPTPSFVASMSQGIRLVPSVAYRIFLITGSCEPFTIYISLFTYRYLHIAMCFTYFYVRFSTLLLFNLFRVLRITWKAPDLTLLRSRLFYHQSIVVNPSRNPHAFTLIDKLFNWLLQWS
jgi:hypothetical protein